MLKAFSIRDTAVEAYMRPFFAQSVAAADRAFSDDIRHNPESPVARHPEDYHLFYIGDFDEVTGTLTPQEPPTRVSSAHDHIARGPALDPAVNGEG